MRTADAIKFDAFGTQSALARALGIDQSSVATWKEYPPPLRQLQIEALTRGALKAEPDCDKYRVASGPDRPLSKLAEAG
jgi:DNA-binding transcriptional regulator YdaS (Cro superfamily)